MSHPLHVLLGANGDLCCMLPWFKAEADRTGKPVPVLVSKDHMPLMEGVSYVAPVEWEGGFQTLRHALEFLKEDLPQVPVKLIQWFGGQKDIHFPSFVHEMWYQAGALPQFGKLPLVFDRRDEKRESQLSEKWITKAKPTILVATKGKSSPFRHAKELMATIRREFGKHCNIVDMSNVKAEKPFDLLGLYDRAAALVTIDTMHAHLSRASWVPTFVLARDYPTLWHGVPYETRFRFYCRYGQWEHRRDEFIGELHKRLDDLCGRDSFGQMVATFLPSDDPPAISGIQSPRGSYNPSFIIHRGKKIMTARHHHNPREWQTRLIANNGTGWCPLDIKTPPDWSHEDMRLFSHRGGAMASFVTSQKRGMRWFCRVGFGKVLIRKNAPKIIDVVYPKIGKNDMTSMEKNWVFFSDKGRLHVIYRCQPDHIVHRITERGRILETMKTPGIGWKYGEVRGGTQPIPFRGKWLRFFHSMEWEPVRDFKEWWIESLQPLAEWTRMPFRYHMGAMLMDNKPPFKVLQISSHPILSGTEEWLPAHPKFKPNVVIPYGATHKDGTFTVAIGVNDAWCREVYLSEKQLNL